MPKHTYQELVAAGAPELPTGYQYSIGRGERYAVTIDEGDKYNFSRAYGFAFVRGSLSSESIVEACHSAYKDLLIRMETKHKEEEWLGVYK